MSIKWDGGTESSRLDWLLGQICSLRIVVPGATKLETNLQKFGICCIDLHGRDWITS